MASNSTSPEPPPLDPLVLAREVAVHLYGPLLIGSFLEVVLYGIFLMQLASYWSAFRSDPLHFKLLVIWMALLATASACLSIAVSYVLGVLSFGDVSALLIAPAIGDAVIMFIGISGPTAQIFYGNRIWKLTKQLWIPAFIWTSAIAEFGCCIYIVTEVEIVRLWSKSYVYANAVTVWVSLSLVTDIVMSATQVYYLQKHRTGFSFTDEIVTHLNRLILQTGAITCINAVLILALFRYGMSHQGDTHLYAAFPMAILYLNCVMSNLNGRRGKDALVQTMHTGETSTPVRRTRVHVTTHSTTTDQDIELGSPTVGDANKPTRPFYGDSDDVITVRKEQPYAI